MRLQMPTPSSHANQAVDPSSGMDGIDQADGNDGQAESAANVGQTQATDKKKARKNRRGGKGKSGNSTGKANASHTEDAAGAMSPSSGVPTVATVLLDDSERLPPFPRRQNKQNSRQGISNIYVPVLPHYTRCPVTTGSEMVASSAASLRGREHGMFATQAIERGTRIISEPALITLPAPGDQLEDLMRAYAKLPGLEQDRIWSLSPAPISASPLLTAIADLVEPVLLRVTELVLIDEADRTEEEVAELERDGPMVEHAAATLRIACRWHAGRYALIDLPERERGTLPRNTPVTGLFVETAGLRHSCVPNCYAHYNATSDRMTVHTLRNVATGEELTLSHLPAIYYLKAADRAAQLKHKFGTTCTCEACDTSHVKFRIHEDARLRAYARVVQLEHFLTLLELVDSDSLNLDLHVLEGGRPEDPPDAEDYDGAEQLALDIIKDLKIAGCGVAVELVRWYIALIDRIQPGYADALPDVQKRLRWGSMVAHAETCVKLARWCLGEDSEEFETLVERKHDVVAEIVDKEKYAKKMEASRARFSKK